MVTLLQATILDVERGYSQKIIGLQCYSQHCRTCEAAEKAKQLVVKDHRCPRNFDSNKSSKMMEPIGTIQHCIDVCGSRHNVYVTALITDDDTGLQQGLMSSIPTLIS